jgi:signal transduction histidine kinase
MLVRACRAVELVNRVRSLSKKAKPERTALDINQALDDALALIRGAILRKGVSLRLELESELPAVWGDRVQLLQVMINLEFRLWKESTRNGSWCFEQNHIETVMSSSRLRNGNMAYPQADGERLFEAFLPTEGVGMGLAICRSIIGAHGGRLRFIRTQVDTGTVFHFTLPKT